ncbi:MAG: glycosyl hydrolase [Bacteroidales bacterium]|nr:glycosyl hydrolase [Bacteroidales bacterium]
MKKLCIPIIMILMASCSQTGEREHVPGNSLTSMDLTSKPFARYWWFASEIKKEDIRYNLNWLKEKGFGGVELAWVYPLNAMDTSLEQSYTPRQEWLSPEWQDIVDYAIFYADSIGLACDLTMGTLWPFGDSGVSYAEASQQYGKDERQAINRSWEFPVTGYVVDHMLPENYMKYFNRMIDSFPQTETKLPQSYFIDSWEVETKGLWYDGLEKEFLNAYGYDIPPLMDSLYLPGQENHLYDYMKLISDRVVAFYDNYDRILDQHNIRSRGQCSGAPCDIISAYARMDIPEGEAMLYEPEYNAIPASAAVLSGKNVVSAETFTCLYGWPRNYIREEQTADLKLVADALFANGVNHIVWHGKAHNPAGRDSVNFYASVHLGDSGRLAPDLPAFNKYLEKVSEVMKQGRPYTDVAVYLPQEDAWMKGIMPVEKQFIWAWGYYEMRYVYFPEILKGHHPLWINREFLEKASYEKGTLKVGHASFSQLYVDAEYLDYESLSIIYNLAAQGLQVSLPREPLEPGTVKHDDYRDKVRELMSLPCVKTTFIPQGKPLLEGPEIPPCRARETENGLYIFFANPATAGIKFPLQYGQSYLEKTENMELRLNYAGKSYDINLEYKPYSSLLYRLKDGVVEELDIAFSPPTPQVKKLPPAYRAPWLVN